MDQDLTIMDLLINRKCLRLGKEKIYTFAKVPKYFTIMD